MQLVPGESGELLAQAAATPIAHLAGENVNTGVGSMLRLAERFVAAIEAADGAALDAIYTKDAVVWRNYDRLEQPREKKHCWHRKLSEAVQVVQVRRYTAQFLRAWLCPAARRQRCQGGRQRLSGSGLHGRDCARRSDSPYRRIFRFRTGRASARAALARGIAPAVRRVTTCASRDTVAAIIES
jgi:hypothetical protein